KKLPMERLKNKIVLVTGGSRGIGAAIVEKLATEGAHVSFTYAKSPEKAEQLLDRLQKAGKQVNAIQADSADPQAIQSAIQQVVSAFGPIDILVNNAGIYIGRPFEEHT